MPSTNFPTDVTDTSPTFLVGGNAALNAGAGGPSKAVTGATGRALIAAADAVAGRTALGLGTAATSNSADFDAAGAAAAVASALSNPPNIYVNGTTGNDTTGTRGTTLLPFKTIEAAVAASVSGDTMRVDGIVTAVTGVDLTLAAKSIRMVLESGAQININAGVTLFSGCTFSRTVTIAGMGNFGGAGKLISGTTILVLECANINTGAVPAGEYWIDLAGANIVSISITRTLGISGMVGGFLRIGDGSAINVSLPQTTDAASRLIPAIAITKSLGVFRMSRYIGDAGIGAGIYFASLGLDGLVELEGATVLGAAAFLTLTANNVNGTVRTAGVQHQGTGSLINVSAGEYTLDCNLDGGGTGLIVVNGATAGVGIRGYVSNTSLLPGKVAVSVVNGQVDIAAKLYGDLSIADGKTVQVHDTQIVGTAVPAGTTGVVKGVGTWCVSTAVTATPAGIAATVDATLF